MHVVLDRFAVTFPGFRFEPLSTTIEPGERIALLGANGAGKSTLMRALAGLHESYEGFITIGGAELRALLPHYRSGIGLLPEKVVGTPAMTVSERLEFTGTFHHEWDPAYASSLVSELELAGDARVGTLSRGMSLKLSFVAAEAHRPWLLLLDEPTSGLDPVIRRTFFSVLRRSLDAGPRRTLVFSTHLLEDVHEFADRIWVLRDGRMTTDTTVAELRRQGGSDSLSAALMRAIDAPGAPGPQ